jgi:hypothetical protein|tara:strand:+ start:532 stop:732 length:201 start_codon:yes stop_codon:yes gene_type:complete
MNRKDSFRIPTKGKSQRMVMAEIDALIEARMEALEDGMCLNTTIVLPQNNLRYGEVIVDFDVKPKS